MAALSAHWQPRRGDIAATLTPTRYARHPGTRPAKESGDGRGNLLATDERQPTTNDRPPYGTSLLLVGPRQLVWHKELLPPLSPTELLIETRAGAISSGTELPLYRGDARAAMPSTYPRMTGYESVGVVRARGAAVRGIAIGERVVATYGHRTHAVIPAHKAYPIPPDLPNELALLLILSGDVLTGIHKLGAPLPEPLLVTGAGAIGLLTIFGLVALGATAVDVVEPLAARRKLARALGARRAFTPQEAVALMETHVAGVECSGRDTAFATLQHAMRPHSRICILSDGNVEPLTLAPVFHERQLAIIGSSDCPDYRKHARWYFPTVRAAISLARLFDRRVLAQALPETFARLAADPSTATKVFVDYPLAR